jgi:hypothetical protein
MEKEELIYLRQTNTYRYVFFELLRRGNGKRRRRRKKTWRFFRFRFEKAAQGKRRHNNK